MMITIDYSNNDAEVDPVPLITHKTSHLTYFNEMGIDCTAQLFKFADFSSS